MALPTNIRPSWKGLPRTNTNLLWTFEKINYRLKRFYKIGHCWRRQVAKRVYFFVFLLKFIFQKMENFDSHFRCQETQNLSFLIFSVFLVQTSLGAATFNWTILSGRTVSKIFYFWLRQILPFFSVMMNVCHSAECSLVECHSVKYHLVDCHSVACHSV